MEEKAKSLCETCQKRRFDDSDEVYYCAGDLKTVSFRRITYCGWYSEKKEES